MPATYVEVWAAPSADVTATSTDVFAGKRPTPGYTDVVVRASADVSANTSVDVFAYTAVVGDGLRDRPVASAAALGVFCTSSSGRTNGSSTFAGDPWYGHESAESSGTRAFVHATGVPAPTLGDRMPGGQFAALFSPLASELPFPAQLAALLAWWNADFVTLVNSGNNVGSITPQYGSSKGDATYILANSDGTFASVPLYEFPDINGKASWGTATDEVRYLETGALSTPISQPVTLFIVYYVFSTTNATYLMLNTSGSATNCCTFISEDPSAVQAAGDTTTFATIPNAISTVYVMCMEYDPATGLSAIYQNAHTATATGQDNGDTITSLFTGAFPDGEPSSYRTRHILLYQGHLSAADRNAVMDYLGADAGVIIGP